MTANNPAALSADSASKSPDSRFLLLVAGLGGLLYGIDGGIIAGALPYLEATSHLTAAQLSSIVAAVLLNAARIAPLNLVRRGITSQMNVRSPPQGERRPRKAWNLGPAPFGGKPPHICATRFEGEAYPVRSRALISGIALPRWRKVVSPRSLLEYSGDIPRTAFGSLHFAPRNARLATLQLHESSKDQ
jgi:hypothetical protein